MTAAWSSSQGSCANRKLDSVQWTAPPSGGRVAVVVEVSNGEVSTQHTWHFNVVPYDPPVLGQADPPTSKEAPLAVKPGETCELSIAVSDPAGLPLTSTWSSSRGAWPKGTGRCNGQHRQKQTCLCCGGSVGQPYTASIPGTQVGHEDYDAHDYSLLLTFRTDRRCGSRTVSSSVPTTFPQSTTWDGILWTDEQVKRVHAIGIDEGVQALCWKGSVGVACSGTS